MGRRPKPTALKLVENSRDRRTPKRKAGEPVPRGRLLDAPEHLDDEERAEWEYVLAHAPFGLLKPIDRELLVCWVEAVCTRRAAQKKLRASTLLIKGSKDNPVCSPYLRIVNQQTLIMKSLAAEFGFSPASRTGIALDDEFVDDEDERTARFFFD